jgi:outer membrane protein assembly factor BamA
VAILTFDCVWANQKPPVAQASSDSLFVQEKDKILPSFVQKLFNGNLSLVASPLINYQLETSWAFGVAGAYYIKSKKKEGRVGVLGFDAAYTLEKQFYVNVNLTTYFGKKQEWLLNSKVKYMHFPDKFYGIGNTKNNLLLDSVGNIAPIRYNSDNFYLNLQPQRYVWGNFIFGLNINVLWENINGLEKHLEQRYNIRGFDKYLMVGAGVVAAYDSRNNFFYPNKGIFFKGVTTHYDKILGSTYRMLTTEIDFRQYIKVYKELTFAYQFITQWTFAEEKPFQMLSTIGGTDILRGIRQNQWTDDVMVVMQTELRIPVWKFIKASAFCSIGDVYNLKNWNFTTPKIGYGAGLRIEFNKSKAHLRFDVARQNFENRFAFYITVNEAF